MSLCFIRKCYQKNSPMSTRHLPWGHIRSAPASGFFIRSALTYRKQLLFRAVRYENGALHTRPPPTSGFKIRYAAASRKPGFKLCHWDENGTLHTRPPAARQRVLHTLRSVVCALAAEKLIIDRIFAALRAMRFTFVHCSLFTVHCSLFTVHC
jgi:hypothetical protein